MEFNGFTDKANDALNCALTCAMSMGHTYVGSEHILYGLCGSNGGVAYTVLRQSGVTCNSIASRINALIGKGLPTQLTVSDFTPRSRRILESAVMIARNAGKTAAGTDHILRAIMRDNECYASVFLHEMGIESTGLDNLIKASYDLLGLISFLTDGKKECRAWTIKRGTKAPQAAGKIHSDFERGFIRAQVISYDALADNNFDYAAVKAKGLQRTEGKEYVVNDGDVIEFLFNV